MTEPNEAKPSPPDNIDVSHFFEAMRGLGHYSDNNKTQAQTQGYLQADIAFRKKDYAVATAAFFDFLKNPSGENVFFFPGQGNAFSFTLLQGTRTLEGRCNGEELSVSTMLAVMPEANVPAMRRLLDLNYKLYYCRAALDNTDTIVMVMDGPLSSFSPRKFYDALRELAINSLKQEDLLLQDFNTLTPAPDRQVRHRPSRSQAQQLYGFYKSWIRQTLDAATALNQDSMAGAISYLLLSVTYRIDFLFSPTAKLLRSLEGISQSYWGRKDDLTLVARNALLTRGIQMLDELDEETFIACLARGQTTFSAAAPFDASKARDNIRNGLNMADWCQENDYGHLALPIALFGPAYNLYNYAMPQPAVELGKILFAALYPDFAAVLGLEQPLYDPASGAFQETRIALLCDAVVLHYQADFPDLGWNNSAISYEDQVAFAESFAMQLGNLKLERKKLTP